MAAGTSFGMGGVLKKHNKIGCKSMVSFRVRRVHGTQLLCPFANEGCKSRHRDEVLMALHLQKDHNAPTTWFRCTVPRCSSALSEKCHGARSMVHHMVTHELQGDVSRASAHLSSTYENLGSTTSSI